MRTLLSPADAAILDDRDRDGVADGSGKAMTGFASGGGKIGRHPFPRDGANVRQVLRRHGEIWWPENGSKTETTSVTRTA